MYTIGRAFSYEVNVIFCGLAESVC